MVKKRENETLALLRESMEWKFEAKQKLVEDFQTRIGFNVGNGLRMKFWKGT